MTHPCDGHACDHCYLCDVVGVCFASVRSDASAIPLAGGCQQRDRLHEAVIAERCAVISLAALVRAEVGDRTAASRSLLPAPRALPAQAGTNHHPKESYVSVARSAF